MYKRVKTWEGVEMVEMVEGWWQRNPLIMGLLHASGASGWKCLAAVPPSPNLYFWHNLKHLLHVRWLIYICRIPSINPLWKYYNNYLWFTSCLYLKHLSQLVFKRSYLSERMCYLHFNVLFSNILFPHYQS